MADAQNVNCGIPCPACGGRTATRRTVPKDGRILRYRYCSTSGCAGRVVTFERPIGEPSPSGSVSRTQAMAAVTELLAALGMTESPRMPLLSPRR